MTDIYLTKARASALHFATSALARRALGRLAVSASLGMFQIITRFVLEQPAGWTGVRIRFSFIWMVFLAIPCPFRQGAMVNVDVPYRWTPHAAWHWRPRNGHCDDLHHGTWPWARSPRPLA